MAREEKRSSDGSVLRTIAPRKHTSGENASKIIGSQIIIGILWTGYPSRVGTDPRGSGAVWVDTRDDIMMKNEIYDFLNDREIVQTRITFRSSNPIRNQ